MRSISRALVAFCVVLGFLAAFATHPVLAGDTHFRYGHYFWTQVDSDTIEITIQNAWRRDGYLCVDAVTLSSTPCSPGDGFPQIGDIIAEGIGFTQFDWGDGTAPVGSPIGPLLFLVTSIDPDENWLFGLALDPASLPAVDTTLSHTYAAPGDYTAFTDSCCRISAAAGINEHINNPDGGYRMETIINVGTLNDSPVSALPPIVRCPIDALCSFVVPGIDPDGDVLEFRLSDSAEASSFGAFIQPGPPDAPNAASIDAVTGLYTWDTTGATLAGNPANNTLYSTQVVIEDFTSKVALDFLIELVVEDVDPPVIEPPVGSPPICETTQVATVGVTKTFDVTASDPDAADIVTLNVAALPVGATMTPILPVAGNPVSSIFSWTPDSDQVGTHVVTFTASSSGGGFALCPVTIEVTEEPPPVLLLHGWCGSPDSFGDLYNILKNDNAVDVRVFAYNGDDPQPGGDNEELLDRYTRRDLRSLAAAFGRFITEVKNETGQPQVDVIAHSMGGILVRAWMAGLTDGIDDTPAYDNDIRKMILAGTPNMGTGLDTLADLLDVFFCREDVKEVREGQKEQMLYGSEFIKSLNESWEKLIEERRFQPDDSLLMVGCGFGFFGSSDFDCNSDPFFRTSSVTLPKPSGDIPDYAIEFVSEDHSDLLNIPDIDIPCQDDFRYQLIASFLGIESCELLRPDLPSPTFSMIVVPLVEESLNALLGPGLEEHGSLPFVESEVRSFSYPLCFNKPIRPLQSGALDSLDERTGWWSDIRSPEVETEPGTLICPPPQTLTVRLKEDFFYSVIYPEMADDVDIELIPGRPTVIDPLPVTVLSEDILPNLVPEFLDVSCDDLCEKDKILVLYFVINSGNGKSGKSCSRFYLSPDKTRGSADFQLDGIFQKEGCFRTESLSPGQVVFNHVTLKIPKRVKKIPGDYYLLICADDTNIVSEIQGSDNCQPSDEVIQVREDGISVVLP